MSGIDGGLQAELRRRCSASAKLETEDQKTLYALGLLIGRNVKPFALKPEELSIVKSGLTDSVTGAKPQVELETYGPKVNELADRRSSVGADETKKKGKEFADNVAKQKDATTTPSGIVIRSITAGAGPNPAPEDLVKVQYEGKLIDGTVFDSSIQRGEPAEFPLNQVVPCWKEALQKLKRAGRRRLFVRRMSHMATMPAADHSPGATLTFEVELLDFTNPN